MTDTKPMPARAQRNIDWIHKHIRVPAGKQVGKPLRLRAWQLRVIRDAYPDDGYVRTVVISISRKRGKTPFAAILVLLHLVGPEAVPNGELYSSAQSKDQAAIVFKYASQMLRMSPELDAYAVTRANKKELECPELGTIYKALSKDAKTKYGLSPVLAVHDELGQVSGPRSELYSAMETAMMAAERPMSIIISTQAPADNDLLSITIDGMLEEPKPDEVLLLEYAPDTHPDGSPLDPFSDEALRYAYPDMDETQNITELRKQARTAQQSPAAEASYRNLVLNQRVDVTAPLVAKAVWQACGTQPAPPDPGQEIYLGLDLSTLHDLTAAVAVHQKSNVWQVRPTFWLPQQPALRHRAAQDRVPYDVWHEHGFLMTTPGAAIEYEYVAAWLHGIYQRNPFYCAFDRWAIQHLRPWLIKAGFGSSTIDRRFIPFGQGTASMSPALRVWETALLNARMAHGQHPVLTMCVNNARVTSEDAANRKLDKKRSRGRIDGAVAHVMAMGLAAQQESKGVILG
jgi:phage terminase large subunit-like protein